MHKAVLLCLLFITFGAFGHGANVAAIHRAIGSRRGNLPIRPFRIHTVDTDEQQCLQTIQPESKYETRVQNQCEFDITALVNYWTHSVETGLKRRRRRIVIPALSSEAVCHISMRDRIVDPSLSCTYGIQYLKQSRF